MDGYNETLKARAAKVDDALLVYVGAGHALFYPFILVTMYVCLRKLYDMERQGKATEGVRIVAMFVLGGFLYGTASISSLGGGYSRSFLVIGDKQYDKDQRGYLNSPPTQWCMISGFLMNMGGNTMVAMSFCMVWNAYRLVSSPIRGKQMHSFARLEVSRKQKVLSKPYLILIPICFLLSLISVLTTSYGPLALYCWIRCSEIGIDEVYTNEGLCWMRLVTMYSFFFVVGVPTLVFSIRLLMHLRKHAPRNSSETSPIGNDKKTSSINQAAKSIGIFSAMLGVIVSAAFVVRIRTSLTPDPNTEGQTSIVEVLTMFIYPVGFYMFAMPNLKYLSCRWQPGNILPEESSAYASSAVDGRRRLSSNTTVSMQEKTVPKIASLQTIGSSNRTSDDKNGPGSPYIVRQNEGGDVENGVNC